METLDVTDWELEYDNTERDPDVLELKDEVQAAMISSLLAQGAAASALSQRRGEEGS